jgi:hypothetical protein
MSEQRSILTPEQAKAMLADGESIHTFRSSVPGVLLGADWDRNALMEAIDEAETLEIGGPACRNMNHGLVVWTGDNPLFVQCRDDVDYDAAAKEAK